MDGTPMAPRKGDQDMDPLPKRPSMGFAGFAGLAGLATPARAARLGLQTREGPCSRLLNEALQDKISRRRARGQGFLLLAVALLSAVCACRRLGLDFSSTRPGVAERVHGPQSCFYLRMQMRQLCHRHHADHQQSTLI